MLIRGVRCAKIVKLGIYMDYNIVALKSSDPIIFNATTKSAVMAEQDSWSFGNAWFMARAASPFLKAWMQEYKGFNDSKWGDLSLGAPHRLYRAGGQDLTKLDYHTWYYPPCCADSSTQKLWFGQSFSDIDDSFGVHQWGGRWRSTAMLTPESVRTIDTPFFCRIRHLFNDIGDDYVAEDWRKNPNCSFTTLDTLPTNPDGLMGSYHFRHDTAIKILDDSGHRLHGWAPYRSGLPVSTDVDSFREFRKDEFAVLPVPIDYDARRGTIRTELLLQNGHTDEVDTAITLAMFRLDDDTKLYWSFVRHGSGNMTVQLEWGVYQQKVPDKSRSVFSTSSVFLDDNRYHVLQLAWDRVDTGLMTVHVDDSQEPLFQGNVTLLDEPVRGGELWINAFREAQTDTGFRGRIRSLRTYSTGYVHELVNGPTTSYSAGAGHTILPMLPESAHNMARTMGFQDMGAMAAWALWGLMSMSAVWVMTARKYGRIKRAWYNVLTPMSPPTSAELERDGTRYADALGSGVELRKTFVRSSSGWGNGSGR